MESLKHKSPNIPPTNRNKMLIFAKKAFFIMLFANALINPIISKIRTFVTSHFSSLLGPVVQRPDNFIQWISRYPSLSICAKISVFSLVQANMHTLTTVKFGSVQKPWTTFYVKYILDPE